MEDVELMMSSTIKKNDAFDKSFWLGKRVWVTGHTGFKGAWLCQWLSNMGAMVLGTSLDTPSRESLAWVSSARFCGLLDRRVDIQNMDGLMSRVSDLKPQIVFHLAAQAIVLDSYDKMSETWGSNVMGTLNVLETASKVGAKAIVAVTSDKCYKNKDWAWGYRESDELGGHDPYSASKAAAEILVGSWRASRGSALGIRIATARAGNVIGGGDNAPWRILPEMLDAFSKGQPGMVRNPHSTRPFQHALEPLSGYMLLAKSLFEGRAGLSDAYNFGPVADGERSAGWLADEAARHWGAGATVHKGSGSGGGKEARVLMLDSSLARKDLGWVPTWSASQAVEMSVAWEKARKKGLAREASDEQIARFEKDTLAAVAYGD
jgi:CDP-glucose 4,6-dehydratase